MRCALNSKAPKVYDRSPIYRLPYIVSIRELFCPGTHANFIWAARSIFLAPPVSNFSISFQRPRKLYPPWEYMYIVLYLNCYKLKTINPILQTL